MILQGQKFFKKIAGLQLNTKKQQSQRKFKKILDCSHLSQLPLLIQKAKQLNITPEICAKKIQQIILTISIPVLTSIIDGVILDPKRALLGGPLLNQNQNILDGIKQKYKSLNVGVRITNQLPQNLQKYDFYYIEIQNQKQFQNIINLFKQVSKKKFYISLKLNIQQFNISRINKFHKTLAVIKHILIKKQWDMENVKYFVHQLNSDFVYRINVDGYFIPSSTQIQQFPQYIKDILLAKRKSKGFIIMGYKLWYKFIKQWRGYDDNYYYQNELTDLLKQNNQIYKAFQY